MRRRHIRWHRCKLYGWCKSCQRPMRVHIGDLNAWCELCWQTYYDNFED